MRVLHLDSGREMRGGQWQVVRLIEGLRAAGVECTLAARAGGALFRAAGERGVHVRPLNWRVMREGADIVHAHDGHTHTRAALAARAPLVIARRVAFPPRSRWAYNRAARIIAISEHVRGRLVEAGIPAEKIAVVHDGVPLLPQAAGDAVIAPASLDPSKGSELAARAAELAGVRVEFSRDLERDLARAAVFVYITREEGLGSGALMAMSAGVAVVASDVGGLREAIRDGETGLLVPNEPQAIATALRRLRDDPALALRLGACARRTVEARFSLEQMVAGTMAVYREVAAGGARYRPPGDVELGTGDGE